MMEMPLASCLKAGNIKEYYQQFKNNAEECYRYQLESFLARQGKLPADYDRVRRFSLATRYKICRERGETYRHKFVISQMIEKYGEDEAL